MISPHKFFQAVTGRAALTFRSWRLHRSERALNRDIAKADLNRSIGETKARDKQAEVACGKMQTEQ